MSAEVLDNPQHEKFAQLIARGVDIEVAYRKIHPECKRSSALSAGSRLLKNVEARVKWLQSQSATATTMDMKERRERLARIVRLNLCDFSAKDHGDLISGLDRIEGTDGEPGIVKMKIDGKRACIMSDAELAGELVDKHEIKHSGSVVVTLDQLKERVDAIRSRRTERENAGRN